MIFLREQINKKYFPLVLFCVFLVIPFLMYSHLIWQDKIFVNGDGISMFGYRLFSKIAMEDGEFPFWNKYLANGSPYASDIFGVYFILNLLSPFFSETINIYLYYAFHVAVGGLFMFLYLKKINTEITIAFITSLIYYFSIHLGGFRKEHVTIISAVVYLPVVLYYAERVIHNKRISDIAYLSFALLAPFVVGGHIQSIIYIYLVFGIYVLMRMISDNYRLIEIIKLVGFIGVIYIGFSLIIILPAVEFFGLYSRETTRIATYEYFTGFSINPLKLIMTFIPKFFGQDVYVSFGEYHSSGFDIEVFSGTIVAVVSFFGVLHFRKNKYISIATKIMVGAWVYASFVHFPFLAKILFRIPVLNSFRVPSRILFVFIFFNIVVFAQTLNLLLRNKEKFKEAYYSLIISFLKKTFIAIGILLLINSMFISDKIWLGYSDIKAIIGGAFQFLAISVVLLVALYKLRNSINYSRTKNIVLIMILAITLIETLPFYYMHNASKLDDFRDVESNFTIKEKIGNYKVWSAARDIFKDYYTDKMISFNLNESYRIPSINAMLPVNNPRLYKLFSNTQEAQLNATGELASFSNSEKNILIQNDMLSMLGVKYIIDNTGIIGNEGSAYIKDKQENIKLIYNQNEFEILPYGEYNIWYDKIKILQNTNYLITLQLEANDEPDLFYIDFYGGENYDNPLQDRHINIKKGKTEYKCIINSGEITDRTEILVRFVTDSKEIIRVRNLKIEEISLTPNIYRPFIVKDDLRIYENTNAKDIFYTPLEVKYIENASDIYSNMEKYDLLNNAYIETRDSFAIAKTKLNNIIWKNNWASVDVESEGDTFVVFGQNYYPAWRVYIDGQRQQLHMVNGIIQGVKVPAGKHHVKFQYFPKMQIIGGIIFLITLLAILVLIVLKRKNIIKTEI